MGFTCIYLSISSLGFFCGFFCFGMGCAPFWPIRFNFIKKHLCIMENDRTQSSPVPEIVLIDEDAGFCNSLKFLLKEHEIELEHSHEFLDILILLTRKTKLLMIDTSILQREGFHHLDHIRVHFPDTKIVLTASGNRAVGNVEGIRRGAAACLLKFFPRERWLRVVQQALC